MEHECSHGDSSIWNSEYSVSNRVDLLIVGDVEAWSGRSVGILRESEFCAVATVQTQFLAGAVDNSHQHCMYTVATCYSF